MDEELINEEEPIEPVKIKYTVNLDPDNFVLSIAHTLHDDTFLDLTDIDLNYLNAYQLVDNVLIMNQQKYDEMNH